MPDKLITLLDRIAKNQFTEADIHRLRQLLASSGDQTKLQLGKFIVNISEGKEIHIGDRIYQNTDVQVLQEVLQSVLKEEQQRKRNQNERRLLKDVTHEVNARLSQSLHNAQFIQLNQEQQPEQINNFLDLEVKGGARFCQLTTRATTPLEMFDSDVVVGRLLILGNPGSGKTTSLLSLAKELIVRAKSQNDYPIPVLLNLSAWNKPKQSMQEWLLTGFKEKYGIRYDVGRKLLNNGRLLLMLDGLDEVEASCQEACVLAINELLAEKSISFYLVVCSRQQEYKLLKTKLNLNGAISLQPLTHDQIEIYLKQIDLPKFVDNVFQELTLANWLKSPLFLSITSLAYQSISLEAWQTIPTTEGRLHYLFDAYIQQMLTRRSRANGYPAYKEPRIGQTLHWLTWLSQQLSKNSQTEFLIEKMQPSFLTQSQLWQYRTLLATLGIGFVVGPVYGLLAIHLKLDGKATAILFVGLIIGIILDWYRDIKPVETLKISWNIPQNRLKIGIRNGLIFAVVGWLIGMGISTSTPSQNSGLVGGMIGGITAGFVGCIDGELIGPDIDTKTSPNEGIRRSALNAVICAITMGLLFALIFSLWDGMRGKELSITVFGLIGMVSGGLIGGGLACLQHTSLRLILWLNGDIPWNYSGFLSYANERLLLQHVGGRYQFIHALLQEHLANARESQK